MGRVSETLSAVIAIVLLVAPCVSLPTLRPAGLHRDPQPCFGISFEYGCASITQARLDLDPLP